MTSYSWLKGRLPTCIMLVVCLAFIPGSVLAEDVEVYAEGAYTETDLVLYIYADITPDILSYGVKLTYETSELTLTIAEKNDEVWFFGDGTPSGNYDYMEPETATPGEVIIIGGKLDTALPADGVAGTRVLLGIVEFDRVGSTIPFTPTLSMDYARGGVFDNFVQTDGTVLDGAGVSFIGSTIAERGDANADGLITNVDMGEIRNLILGNVPGVAYRVYADANGDGQITNVDMGTVRNIILGID